MNWRARPVFVSGTFRDMHEERDLLAARVFPALEEQLTQFYTTVERVDLRIGVDTSGLTDDHAKQALVLKVCLADVARCRPFMVVLVGDRYGWVPPVDRLQAAAAEGGLSTTVEGKSVTALEIEYGLLADPRHPTRSRIYFRQLDYTGIDEAHAAAYSDERASVSDLVSAEDRARAAERAAALSAAKRRLRVHPVLGPRCRDYRASWDPATNKVAGLTAFVDDVISDLLPEIVAEAKEQAEAARFGILPTALEQFVAERSIGFRGRAHVVARLAAHAAGAAESDVRGRIVVGPSGGGKSAVFARVFQEITTRGPDYVWLFAHAAGTDPKSASVTTLLEDWVAQLSSKLGVENPLKQSPEHAAVKPDEVFGELLMRAAAKRRVVLLLDALDRFERTPQAEYVTWLPARLPVNVRVVATAVAGPETAALAGRSDMVVETLAPVTDSEAREISTSVYGRYHRDPNQDAVNQLLTTLDADGAPAHGNALWLVSALEELNLLDGDDFQRAERGVGGSDEDRLHAMVVDEARGLPGDVGALYVRIFERASRRVSDDPREGLALAQAFTTVLALSRLGFRERDLATLVPRVAALIDPSAQPLTWNGLAFAALRRALRAHVTRRGEDDRWDLHHAQARLAADRTYVPNDDVRKQIHAAVADYLLRLPGDDFLRESESMHHLLRSGDLARAAQYYSEVAAPRASEAATRVLSAAIVQQQEGRVSLPVELLAAPGLSDEVVGRSADRFVRDLFEALRSASLDHQEEVARAAHDQLERLCAIEAGNAGWHRALSISCNRLFRVLTARGDVSGALIPLQQGHAIDARFAAVDPDSVMWQRALAISHEQFGDMLEMRGDLVGALAANEASLSIRERLAAADPDNAALLREIWLSNDQIGDVLEQQGNLPAALTRYQTALAGSTRLALADPDNATLQRDRSVSHDKLGYVLKLQNDLPGALAEYQASLAIVERLAARDPGNTLWQQDLVVSRTRIGDILERQKELPGAVETYQATLLLQERLVVADPGNADWQKELGRIYLKLADVLMALGGMPAALKAYESNIGIHERLVAAHPDHVRWQGDLAVSHVAMIKVLTAQGNLSGALASGQTSLAIRERLVAADPANEKLRIELTTSHFEMAGVLTAQGNLSAALAHYEAMAAIQERLAAAHPDDANQQRLLLFSLYNVARHPAQSTEGTEHYRRGCLRVLRHLKAGGVPMEPPLVALLEELERAFPHA